MNKGQMIKEEPTTFQLAQLAAQAAPPNTRPKDAVRRAMALAQLPLRIAAIYSSGRRSIHALIRMDATSKADLVFASQPAWRSWASMRSRVAASLSRE